MVVLTTVWYRYHFQCKLKIDTGTTNNGLFTRETVCSQNNNGLVNPSRLVTCEMSQADNPVITTELVISSPNGSSAVELSSPISDSVRSSTTATAAMEEFKDGDEFRFPSASVLIVSKISSQESPSPSDIASPDELRFLIVSEILETEKSYVSNLETLMVLFIDPLLNGTWKDLLTSPNSSAIALVGGSTPGSMTTPKNLEASFSNSSSSSGASTPIISPNEVSSEAQQAATEIVEDPAMVLLFENVGKLYQLHTEFLKVLENRVQTWDASPMISTLFLDYAQLFRIYCQYAKIFDRATVVIEKAMAMDFGAAAGRVSVFVSHHISNSCNRKVFLLHLEGRKNPIR
jgi:hypothetical protein